MPPTPTEPFGELPKLLKLAQHENVAVKISGACTLSHEPFPYGDLWDPLGRVFDAFGFGHCMWGTDWTRAINLLTYKQGVAPFRLTGHLSDDDRAELMGRSLHSGFTAGRHRCWRQGCADRPDHTGRPRCLCTTP